MRTVGAVECPRRKPLHQHGADIADRRGTPGRRTSWLAGGKMLAGPRRYLTLTGKSKEAIHADHVERAGGHPG
jgi:hypothetical protein